MKITIKVPGIPQPAGSKRVVKNRHSGKAHVIDACARSRDWKTTVAQVASDAYSGDLLRGPISLHITFIFQRPKNHFRKNGTLAATAPTLKTTKPDLTKLVRAAEDALTGVVWYDDSQVVEIAARKTFVASNERTETVITIIPLAAIDDIE